MNEKLKMCKIKPDDWDTDKTAIRDRVRNARHICSRCFRTANDESLLCKPKKIK